MKINLDELSKAKWNDSYRLHESASLWGETQVPYVQEVISRLQIDGATTVLDLPCGDGRNTVPLAKSFPVVVAADSSKNALNIAQQMLEQHHLSNCLLMEADIFGLPYLDHQFDGVFCWDVLGHLLNINAAIQELVRVCRPGGLITGSVFATGDSTRGLDMRCIDANQYIYREQFFFHFYDREELVSMLQPFDASLISLDLAVWMEPPHEGYRPYEHEHQSWAFTLRKH